MLRKLRKKIREYQNYYKIAELPRLIRRYMVLGALDGALTILGVVLGAHLMGEPLNSNAIVNAGILGGVALGISNAWGAYEAERIERERNIDRIERAMLCSIDNSVIAKAEKFAIIIAAVVHGISPAAAAIIPTLPFLLAANNLLLGEQALTLSIGLTLTLLFILGAYLGRISKISSLFTGLRMVAMGVIISAICILFGG